MSKITVGVPPNFSPLLCPQKNWEKVECQIEQHKKHTYNITTIGPFFFLNPTNKKNYPFLIFIPNYTPDPLPKKCNSCTLSIKFSKPIPSITFMSSREDQIREIYAYVETSKREIGVFLENVKISENIISMGFDQYSENSGKPVKVIPNIQFMNGKWQLQTLYKEQAKELKTIQIEPQKIIALPCFEIPHKFGSNDIAIYSFFIMSRTDPATIYFRTPEIDEMIKWILFIYAYLHISPNAVGAPFPRMQSVPIKKSSSNFSSQMSNQLQSPASITENNNEGSNFTRSSTLSSNASPKPKQTPVQNQNSKQPSVQMQKQPQRQTPVQNQNPKPAQIANSPSQADPKRKTPLERKSSNSIYPSTRQPALSQSNIQKPTPPLTTDSKSASKVPTNFAQPQNQTTPKPASKSIFDIPPSTPATPTSTPTAPTVNEIKKNDSNEGKTNSTAPTIISPPIISTTNDTDTNNNTNNNDNDTNKNNKTNNDNKSTDIEVIDDPLNVFNNPTPQQPQPQPTTSTTIKTTETPEITKTNQQEEEELEITEITFETPETIKEPEMKPTTPSSSSTTTTAPIIATQSAEKTESTDEQEKDDYQDFALNFESLVVEDFPTANNNNATTSFPSIQFIDASKGNKNVGQQPTITTIAAEKATTTQESSGRTRSFSVKRRNSSISSQALDSIRSEKQIDIDDKDDYKIPDDLESQIESNLAELDKKYSNMSTKETKQEIFQPPDYNEIVSSTLVSMSTLASSNSRTMQIKTLLGTIDDDASKDVVDFPFVDQIYEQTVEDTLNNMSSEDKVDLSSFFKFNEYPEFDSSTLTNSVRPRNNFIDEFTLIDQGLRQSSSISYDLNNTFVVRLCFLVACTIVNGLKDFTDQSSTVSIVEPLRQLSIVLSDLSPIVNEVSNAQTTLEQASIAATMMIKKNLIGAFLREVKRTDNWASKYYTPSAMLCNYEFIDTFVLMLEPMLNTMTFNVDISSTIFKSVLSDDVNRYAYTPLFSYLEIDELFNTGADPVKIISRQFEIGLKKSKKFLNSSAWDVLEKLSQDQRYSAAYYQKFANSINASKAFFGSSKSKLESWVSDSISSKNIHVFFMLVHINLTLLNSPDYYDEASLIDPFRANYIMKKLCKYISRP